jgi:hypothetical protein
MEAEGIGGRSAPSQYRESGVLEPVTEQELYYLSRPGRGLTAYGITAL